MFTQFIRNISTAIRHLLFTRPFFWDFIQMGRSDFDKPSNLTIHSHLQTWYVQLTSKSGLEIGEPTMALIGCASETVKFRIDSCSNQSTISQAQWDLIDQCPMDVLSHIFELIKFLNKMHQKTVFGFTAQSLDGWQPLDGIGCCKQVACIGTVVLQLR